MKSPQHNRRKFLSTISGGALGGLILNMLPSREAIAQSPTSFTDEQSEYLFPPGLIYLNSGTLGPCRRETIEESTRLWKLLETLPVQFYGSGDAASLAEKTRTTAAEFLGCDVNEMLITSSTTDGMNAIAQGLRLKSGDRIITTDQEHDGGLLCWKYFKKYYDVEVDTLSIPPGENDADLILNRISDVITPETRLISISHVFSSTGLRTPIEKISALARSKNILCVVDGAQAAGGIKVNVRELGCHAYATSGHKWLMGPKGTGLLYLSKEAQEAIRPMQYESSYNTYNGSSGVRNLASILGLSKAIEYLNQVGISKIEEHNLALKNRLYDRLTGLKHLKIVSPASGPLSSPLLACRLDEQVESSAFSKMLLDKHKISIRATHKQWFNGIRFSMHIFNTEKEVDFVADIVRRELGAIK